MRCLDCTYELHGLGTHTCPECGRAFDPADAETFADPARPRLGRAATRRWTTITLIAGGWPMLSHALILIALVAARLELGRWPRRYGADDPTNTPIAAWVSFAGVLSLLGIFPAIVIGLGGVVRLLGGRRARHALLGALIGVTLWVGGIALLRLDPAEAWVWAFD